MAQKHTQSPMLESDDLKAQEDKSDELCAVPDVATTCSICLEDLGKL
jgi:hypothetical protein